MHTTHDAKRGTRNDSIACEAESPPTGTRRSLFVAAASGLSLVASGLIVPTLPLAAMAGGKLQSSRSRAGIINTQYIGFEIKNLSSAAVQFQAWEWDDEKKRWVGGNLVALGPPGPDDNDYVRGTDGRLAIHTGDGFFVLARDANQQTVEVEIGEGPCDASGCTRNHRLNLLTSQRLQEEESMSAANITVTRLRNSKRVLLHIELT